MRRLSGLGYPSPLPEAPFLNRGAKSKGPPLGSWFFRILMRSGAVSAPCLWCKWRVTSNAWSPGRSPGAALPSQGVPATPAWILRNHILIIERQQHRNAVIHFISPLSFIPIFYWRQNYYFLYKMSSTIIRFSQTSLPDSGKLPLESEALQMGWLSWPNGSKKFYLPSQSKKFQLPYCRRRAKHFKFYGTL